MDPCRSSWIAPGIKIIDLNIPNLDTRVNAKVSELVDGEGNWNCKLLNHWIPHDLLRKITSILPHRNDAGPDTRIGMQEMTARYSVGSMYQAIIEQDDNINDVNWMKVWKFQAPERIRCFIWMLCYDGFLTNFKKCHMGLGSSMHNFYQNMDEYTFHVLRD